MATRVVPPCPAAACGRARRILASLHAILPACPGTRSRFRKRAARRGREARAATKSDGAIAAERTGHGAIGAAVGRIAVLHFLASACSAELLERCCREAAPLRVDAVGGGRDGWAFGASGRGEQWQEPQGQQPWPIAPRHCPSSTGGENTVEECSVPSAPPPTPNPRDVRSRGGPAHEQDTTELGGDGSE